MAWYCRPTFEADLRGTLIQFSWDKIIYVQQGNIPKRSWLARIFQCVFSWRFLFYLHFWTNQSLLCKLKFKSCALVPVHMMIRMDNYKVNYSPTIVKCCCSMSISLNGIKYEFCSMSISYNGIKYEFWGIQNNWLSSPETHLKSE